MGRLPKVGERENRNTGGEEIDMSRVVDVSCPPAPATCGRRGVEVSRIIKAGGCVEVEVWYWVEPKVEWVTIFAVRRSQKMVDWLFICFRYRRLPDSGSEFAPFEKVRLEIGDGHRTPVIIFHTGTHLLRLRPTTGAHKQRLYLG